MWQTYALGSLLAGAFESAADKAGMARDGKVDSYVASFYRSFFFTLAATLVGLSGILGEIYFFFHWSVILLGCIGVASTILFTFLLRTIEITGISAAAYLAPFAFLLIDTYFIGMEFSQAQILGVLLLVCGGIAFSFDGKTHHFKRELTWKVAGAFCFIYLFHSGIENYTFKHLNAVEGVNAVSFFASYTLLSTILILALVLAKGRGHALVSKTALTYIPYAAIGKVFDAFNVLLFATALTFAAVSQVSAFNALFPLVVFLTAAVTQSLFRIRLKEKLDRDNVLWKLGAALILVIGGILVG